MLNPNHSSYADIQLFGRDLFRNNLDGLPSMEHAAQVIINAIGNNFVDDQNQPITALIRIFYGCSYTQLPDHYRPKANPRVPFWLSLMATAGIVAAWNDPLQSRHHQVIPVDDTLSPMFRAAFAETALQLGITAIDDLPTNQSESGLSSVFFVPKAIGSSAVTDQAEFVEPYGIQSVLGLGSSFMSGEGFLLLLFSQAPLTQNAAEAIGNLAPFIATLLAAYHGRGSIWS